MDKNKTLNFVRCICIDLLLIIVCIVNIKLTSDRSMLTEENSKQAQTISDLTAECESLQNKLTEAQNDLQDCSQEIEILETELVCVLDTVVELQEENKYLTEMCDYVYNGDWCYEYDDDDIHVLAGVMYAENYGSGRYEMMLTGSVVLNRVLSKDYPNTIRDVVYQKSDKYEQYAPRTKRIIDSETIPDECYTLAQILLDYGPIAPRDVVYQAHFNQGEVFWEYKGEEFCFTK